MENFLKQLYIIAKEYKMLADREEKFNIFAALHKIHDERRLHSRFISVLLQPDGSHGFGNQFLKLFIKEINDSGKVMSVLDTINGNNKEEDDNNLKLVNLTCLENTRVYPKEYDKKENSNIDILVIDRVNRQCLIIENKIYAGDSNTSGGQLDTYIKHVLDNEKIPLKSLSVVYLTLDGHAPSDESIEEYGKKKEIILCSYPSIIIPWLEKCLSLTSRTPYLRESIIQYIKLIKKMTTDDSSDEERRAYRNLIGESKENMLSAKKLIENFKHVKWYAVQEFWFNLQQKIEDNNYQITKHVVNQDGTSDLVTELTWYEEYRKGQKNKQHCYLNFRIDETLEISIRYNPNWPFYFGVSSKAKITSEVKEKLERLTQKNLNYEKSEWMTLYKRFDNNIQFNNFNQDLAFSLISPETNKELVEAAWSEVEAFIKDIKE